MEGDIYIDGGPNMEHIENLISVIDYSLSDERKRHIAGGILLSISLLFGCLAFTVMTLKTGGIDDEQ